MRGKPKHKPRTRYDHNFPVEVRKVWVFDDLPPGMQKTALKLARGDLSRVKVLSKTKFVVS